jgi:tight adherence protein C
MDAGLLIALVSVFTLVALVTGTIASHLAGRVSPERRRLQQVSRQAVTDALVNARTLSVQEHHLAERAANMVPRSPKEMGRLRNRFARAGYEGLTPIAIFTVAQILTPVGFGLVPLFVAPAEHRWVLAALGVVLGLQAPQLVLQRLIKKRQKVIENGLPDALDLMIVCLEAGSAIDQAILRVSDELALAYPPLADELRLVITETRAGKRRVDAFQSFAERTGIEDVRSLAATLVQTERFGTSIAQALRTQAETSRTKRRQRAEEAAAKVGVKLAFPLVFFLFPAFFVVTLGPAAIQFLRVFADLL